MFWDGAAVVYVVFVNVINRKTHQELKEIISDLIESDDTVLEYARGTGLLSAAIAPRRRHLTATDFSEKPPRTRTLGAGGDLCDLRVVKGEQ